ncbi:mutagen-sensitive 304 isoform X2 [Temnothorax americanus]|uniref:mutagen-sensitive 304 isoform X2 n=1 Tax=Temnothorax americanus TaxID=1964332 RepID=UPI004067B7B1
MFKRSEETIMDDYRLPAKRAKFDNPNKNLEYRKTQEEIPTNRNAQNDDLWGDDFDEEDIEEMDLIVSQACVQVLLLRKDDKELEKLKTENKKLLNDFITKDGETAFLRQQLQQTQLRIENEKLEKMRLIEEQANRHRSEINKIYKEKEQLKTQLELQDLEIGNLQERCKLLESGNIKLKEPQMLYMNTSVHKCKYTTPINRTTNINKNLKVKEAYVQANVYKKSDYQLKTYNTYIPLARISELIFGASLPEKSIVNIKVIEKTGRRNLPILQEEETFRIFENPELVKPIVTTVNGKRLTTEFVLLEITAIERRVNTEIESERCIPIMNKLVLTTRELILNVITVLETIFQAMKNDDIRDMNDLYFSMVYKDHNICIKSECEADAWHEGERGVEARRLLGILSYISIESSYLSNYIAGKSQLLTRSDECYNHYLQQMTRYSTWSKKGYEFEMLEIILECVTLIERVRRSHQFTGLINAIIKLLCNVQQKVGYCDKGLEYIYLIFKELVFSRPLSLCYVSLANFIMVFSKCNVFVSKLCTNSQLITIKRWKGVLHFTPDACVLQIYMAQVENFYPDFFTAVNMTYALISSVWHLLQKNNLLRSESSESCNCYTKLLRFIINMLKKCSENKLDIIDNTEWQDSYHASKKFIFKRINYKDHTCQMKCNKQNMEKHLTEIYSEKLDRNFWFDIKKIHYKVLRHGIRFLCHLAICDPDFVIRSSDIEDSFHLFIQNIAFFDDLILHENEREALDRIKTTFIVDKDVQCETETRYENTHVNQLHMTNFEKKVTPTTERSRHTGPIENYNKVYMAIKALYNSKSQHRDN